MSARVGLAQARRIALGAQGLGRVRPVAPGARHLNRLIDRIGLFQIDSVNVLQRAHYMPAYARLGPYDPEMLHRAFGRRPRRLFEYWAHEAALVDVGLYPALRWRMWNKEAAWGGPRRVAAEKPDLVAQVHADVAARGPVTARGLDQWERGAGLHWGWNWSDTKCALEYLFAIGEVTSAGRTSSFERLYDLTDRVIPEPHLAAPALESDEAHRVLVERAARAHGIATERCLRDYFRTKPEPTRRAIAELVDAGVLEPVTVGGWDRPAYLHAAASRPRRIDARTLLSPFDPVVFERNRLAELFGFHYRIEIYVPAPKRVHGYYVLPFLLGDQMVARVDLKADRSSGRLIVRSAFAEPHAPGHTAAELAAELRTLADWLELTDITVEDRGDLASALHRAVASGTS